MRKRWWSVAGLILVFALTLCVFRQASAQSKVLIPMDLSQTDHLKAYGIAYWALTKGIEIDWLLNYRGGSFMIDDHSVVSAECRIRGVGFTFVSASDASQIYSEV